MLILAIRTEKPEAEIGLFDDEKKLAYETWEAHRQLAVCDATRWPCVGVSGSFVTRELWFLLGPIERLTDPSAQIAGGESAALPIAAHGWTYAAQLRQT